jgi:hypothetical protein
LPSPIHDAVKSVIRENLPEEKKVLYDHYKTKMAKLFDVREILKAKNLANKGTSFVKKAGKAVIGAGFAVGAVAGLKKIFQ